jgi:hypothetical protein
LIGARGVVRDLFSGQFLCDASTQARSRDSFADAAPISPSSSHSPYALNAKATPADQARTRASRERLHRTPRQTLSGDGNVKLTFTLDVPSELAERLSAGQSVTA